MKNRFNLTEEEKNRIRGLHLTESKDKRITSTINESPEFLYEDMDASNVDLGNAAETEEEDWLRFMLGWIVKLFRAPVTAFTKSLRKNSPMVGPNYGRRRAWPCKKRYKRW